MAFLPRLAKQLLGQELRLPSVATWWCGQPAELDYVLKNLSYLVLRPISRSTGTRAVFGNLLDSKELAAWRDRIRAHPYRFVGQEQLEPASLPALREGKPEPRHGILRTFLAAGRDSFVVMPGGLTRVGTDPDSRIISNQNGAISKDTWVLASEPEQIDTLLPQGLPAYPQQETLPGVAAENLFWMSRYAERAETMIRLIRSIHALRNETLQLADPVSQAALERLLLGLTHMSMTWPGFTEQNLLADPVTELADLITNRKRTGSLSANLAAFLDAAYTVRNLVSSDTRRVFNDIGDELAGLARSDQGDLRYLMDTQDRIITALMAIAGATGESMSREHGWHFLKLGRRIERALLMVALLRSLLGTTGAAGVESLLLQATLSVTESFTLYRRRFRSRPQPEAALDLLLLEESNTRSLVYQVVSARRHLEVLPGQDKRPYKQEMRLILEATTLLNLASAEDLAVADGGRRPALEVLLGNLEQNLSDVSNALTASYFTHIERPYQLVEEDLLPA
jgi:uncharacterized alpha-E superfamily protein